MAISFTGTGGLFTRLGLLLGGVNEMNTFMQTTQGTRRTNILAQYLSNEQDVVSDISSQLTTLRQSPLFWLSMLQNDAVQTTIEQTNRDVPLNNLTLRDALTEVISQMSTTTTLSRPTVSTTVTAGASNYGSTVLLATLKDVDGLTKYLVFPETLTATVTSDAGRGATAYAEPISVVGLPTVDPLSPLWPQGSGSSTGFSVQDNFVDNIVTNGSFNGWNAGGTSINNWVIASCGGASTIVRATDPVRGTYCLQFTGDGTSTPCLYQILPTGSLLPNTVYALQFWAKRSSGTPAGVFRVRLTDGLGNTISDDAGTTNSNSTTVSSGLTTSYGSVSAFFVTPKVLPSEVRLYIDFTTALANTATVTISLLGMQATTTLYQGGPNVAAFSGLTQAAINDTWDIAVANDGGTTIFLTALERFFSTRTLGLKFPSANSGAGTNISNSLIA